LPAPRSPRGAFFRAKCRRHHHPALKGKNIREIKDKNGKALGEEMMTVAKEGKFDEVSYMWPRPGADTTAVQKVSYVTKAGDQVCGVGYYK
jgi:signal transduction histidine kinase